jgi:hypothetical protein
MMLMYIKLEKMLRKLLRPISRYYGILKEGLKKNTKIQNIAVVPAKN